MSSDTLQAKKTMQAIMGIAPGNVYGVRHDKKGFLGTHGFGKDHPRTFTHLRRARTHATGWARTEEDDKLVHVVELELVEVREHTRLKQRGGE